ncbi:hypothetical protein [Enterobacter phage EspM4VN]|uniref:Uncharacterized protein n=1 Tax=Enterobacter phage EspM4VN TaxID=2137745 RepID=A0A4P2WVB9_9CAUD|nr:hypothetical protein HYP11_gp218 [Enterobacter phage EspM4VN]BBK03766.1 hypothetical protein [Enterobacter phage EspM4VN]
MKTFKEFLTEANKEYNDFDEWKQVCLKKNPKAEFTKEGHGGSEFVVASTPGSAQMTGKWFGNGKTPKGRGIVYGV